MKSETTFSLERKRIVNTRVSEEEYCRLRRRAFAQGVSLSHLMRSSLEPYIRPRQGQDYPICHKCNPTENAE